VATVWGATVSMDQSLSLHPLERAYLQGFPPAALAGLSKRDMLRSTGNAMSVPTVASVLARLLNGLEPDAGIHVRWQRAEELQAMAAVRASKLHRIQALAELSRQTRSEVAWHRATPQQVTVLEGPWLPLQAPKRFRLRSCQRKESPPTARYSYGWQPRCWGPRSALSSSIASSSWTGGAGSWPARGASCTDWPPLLQSSLSSKRAL
jgi:hypothetical protein